jgi:hypothetical protein
MNKQIKGLFFVFIMLASLGLLSACNKDEEIQVSSITINQDTVLDSYEVGTFDLTSVELIVQYNDGSTETIDLDPSMIEESDLVKLSTAGTHEITVNHLGQTVTLSIELYTDEQDTTLLLIYQLGVESGSIDMTYEEWLESIRGEDGQDGKDGNDGLTPYIGENGNWWIGDNDLGVASGQQTENIGEFSEGLVFSLTTYDGTNAYVVTGYYGSDKNVIIPGHFNGLKVVGIGQSAFSHTWRSDNYLIESVFIPKEIEFIGVHAFENKTYLTEVTIENNSSLKIIDQGAFINTGISEIILPESLLYIGAQAFISNELTNVMIKGDEGRFNSIWRDIGFPDALRPGLIEYEGLLFDRYLQEIIDYQGASTDVVILNEIGGYAVISIGDYAFQFNSLTSVTLPSTLISIGRAAFLGNSLTSITLPEGVTSIGYRAFAGNSLKSVTIPEGVTSIGSSAFSSNQLTSVTIPEGVTSIGDSAFRSNDLTSVTIPEGVTSIGDEAFANNDLTSVILPGTLTSIGRSAFESNDLTSITIPEGVTSIGERAFYGNQLTSVTISEGVTSIGWRAFYENSLTSVTILGDEDRFNDVWDDVGFPSDLKPE